MVESEIQMDNLTAWELEILRLIAKGCTTMEIAYLLKISHHTVETYRKTIHSKLNVKNCAELA
jgi:DNA-binding CsgD family transcriptional regulator